MPIHHATLRKAEKLGFTLREEENSVVAHWPQYNVRVHGVSPQDAINQMEAAKQIKYHDDRIQIVVDEGEPRKVFLIVGVKPILPEAATPHEAWNRVKDADLDIEALLSAQTDEASDSEEADEDEGSDAPTDGGTSDPVPPVLRSENGVALDGAVAYAEGTPAGDCPFDEGTDEAEAWWAAWDAAADAKEEDEDEKGGGSVVKDHYRAKYTELGHPTHCGDWLATTLNAAVQNDGGTNIDLFESICNMNGVSLDKLNRTSRGWQGRFRMTGRNMLARKVYANDGKLVLPETMGGEKVAPAEWMASQKFKVAKKTT